MTAPRGARHWWAWAFAVLFVAYQSPQVLARLGVPGSLASLPMLAVYLLAAWIAWRSGMGFGQAYGLAWRGGWPWLPALFALAIGAKASAVAVGVHAGIYVSHGPAPQVPAAMAWAASPKAA